MSYFKLQNVSVNVHCANSVTVVLAGWAGTVAIDVYGVPEPLAAVFQPANTYIPVTIVGAPVGLPVAADGLAVEMFVWLAGIVTPVTLAPPGVFTLYVRFQKVAVHLA